MRLGKPIHVTKCGATLIMVELYIVTIHDKIGVSSDTELNPNSNVHRARRRAFNCTAHSCLYAVESTLFHRSEILSHRRPSRHQGNGGGRYDEWRKRHTVEVSNRAENSKTCVNTERYPNRSLSSNHDSAPNFFKGPVDSVLQILKICPTAFPCFRVGESMLYL